mmetsp:Transcript_11241/g.28466  ORF Transcript_11241/g.28466 Transcript_11241/m.28466 type:complete len:260 (+) Transcript_11241:109-888(+)
MLAARPNSNNVRAPARSTSVRRSAYGSRARGSSGAPLPFSPMSGGPSPNPNDLFATGNVPEIYAGQGPPPAMVMERFQSVISQLFQYRIVRLGGAVDDEMANLLVAQLLYLDSTDSNKDIVMYVNSPGGSVTAGMSVFDTMRHVRPDISTVCVGLAASMGAFILASGEKGKRLSLPNSRIMIHQPLGGAQGQAADIEIQANEILHHKLTLNGYLSEFSGQPLEKVMEDTDRDFFMSPVEAVEYGVIDGIVSGNQLGVSL